MNVYLEQEQFVKPGRDFEVPGVMCDKFVSGNDREYIVKCDYANMLNTREMLSGSPARFTGNETDEFHFRKRSRTLHHTFSYDAEYSSCPPIEIPDFDMEADINMDLLMTNDG